MIRAIILTFAFISPIVLSACNTMEGLGQDVQGTGRSLERAADENK